MCADPPNMGRKAADLSTPVPVLGVPALVGVRGWRSAEVDRPAGLAWSHQCSVAVQTSPVTRTLHSQVETKQPDRCISPLMNRVSKLSNGSIPQIDKVDKDRPMKGNVGRGTTNIDTDTKTKKGVTFEVLVNEITEDITSKSPKVDIKFYAKAIKTNPYLPSTSRNSKNLVRREHWYTNGSVVNSELIGGICSDTDETNSPPLQKSAQTKQRAVAHAGKRLPPGPPPCRAPPHICTHCGGRQAPTLQASLDQMKDLTFNTPAVIPIQTPGCQRPSTHRQSEGTIKSLTPRQVSRDCRLPPTRNGPTNTHFPLQPIININKDGKPNIHVSQTSMQEKDAKMTRVIPLFASNSLCTSLPPTTQIQPCPDRPPAHPPAPQAIMFSTVSQEKRTHFSTHHHSALFQATQLPWPNTLELIPQSDTSTSAWINAQNAGQPQTKIKMHSTCTNSSLTYSCSDLDSRLSTNKDARTCVRAHMPSDKHPKRTDGISVSPHKNMSHSHSSSSLKSAQNQYENANPPSTDCSIRHNDLFDHSDIKPQTNDSISAKDELIAENAHTKTECVKEPHTIINIHPLHKKDFMNLKPNHILHDTHLKHLIEDTPSASVHVKSQTIPSAETPPTAINIPHSGINTLKKTSVPFYPIPTSSNTEDMKQGLNFQHNSRHVMAKPASTAQTITGTKDMAPLKRHITLEAAKKLHLAHSWTQDCPQSVTLSHTGYIYSPENQEKNQQESSTATTTQPYIPNKLTHSHPPSTALLLPSSPQCEEPHNPTQQLMNVEASLRANQEKISTLLNIIQDLEMNQAVSKGRRCFQTGQDLGDCPTCQETACIVYRQQERSFQNILKFLDEDDEPQPNVPPALSLNLPLPPKLQAGISAKSKEKRKKLCKKLHKKLLKWMSHKFKPK
ncbi:uncharacterized protein LOC114792576 isoform X3 [Denticeps clupeoides]|uniref:uncharacterized protein LOC114792576 isoform X3 n=1 Tax=Denticeps clupeoides TaxID=299321 RepID=UPI0010A59896|nr:uncharacterized protein LOC114792576 isoform X3 [Denticeps clupeoides]